MTARLEPLFDPSPDGTAAELPADAPWAARLAGLAARCRGLVGGRGLAATANPAGVGLYVFGKHPAWRDFIDPAVLPPEPPAFAHFHRRLRPAAEAAYARDGKPPRLLAWRGGAGSAVLLVLPSRDAGDPAAGSWRACPLFLGVGGRLPLDDLVSFAGPRLAGLAAELQDATRTAEEFVDLVDEAAVDWPQEAAADVTDRHCPPAAAPGGGRRYAALFGTAWGRVARLDRTGGHTGPAGGGFFLLTGPAASPFAAAPVDAAAVGPTELASVLRRVVVEDEVPAADRRRRGAAPEPAPVDGPEPPVLHILPGPQPTLPAEPLVLAVANGNGITVGSAGVGDRAVRVLLTARRGSVRLARAEGLAFTAGGTGDCLVAEFVGDLAAVNSALDGLRFTPTSRRGGGVRVFVTRVGAATRRPGGAAVLLDATVDVQLLTPA